MSNVDTVRREQIAALTSGEEIDKVLGIHKNGGHCRHSHSLNTKSS